MGRSASPYGCVGRHVSHSDAAGGLLECEMPQVSQDEGQLLAVVGPARWLFGAFDENDPERFRGLAGERADLVAQLVVGDEEPATVGWRWIDFGKPLVK